MDALPKVRIETEIEASPEEVRAVALDFARYPEWQTKFPKTIKLPDGKTGLELKEGDKLYAEFSGSTIEPVILNNTPAEFKWRGSAFYGAFAGDHYWKFVESETTPGGTTLLHGEEYTGWASMLFKPGWPLNGTANSMFAEYSKELKERVEGLKNGVATDGKA